MTRKPSDITCNDALQIITVSLLHIQSGRKKKHDPNKHHSSVGF